MARSVSVSAVSVPSTAKSGGRPPWDSPRSIDPRAGWKRRPSSRAAWISAPSRSPAPRGKMYGWSAAVVQPLVSRAVMDARAAA